MSDTPQFTHGFMLNDVARLLRKRFEQNARGLGLTRAQWQVLSVIGRNEGFQQRALADILEVEPITLGRILDRLESADLIERRRHVTDRRVWQLYLKPKALPLIEQMREIGNLTRIEAFAGVSETDLDTLLRILTETKTNLIAACNAPPATKKVTHG